MSMPAITDKKSIKWQKVKKPYVPDHSALEFKDIMEKFRVRGEFHQRLTEVLAEDQTIVTKAGRLNKTALLRSMNRRLVASIHDSNFDPEDESNYQDLKEEDQINIRQLEDLVIELRRCFEHYD